MEIVSLNVGPVFATVKRDYLSVQESFPVADACLLQLRIHYIPLHDTYSNFLGCSSAREDHVCKTGDEQKVRNIIW